jgi:hypothetical protein
MEAARKPDDPRLAELVGDLSIKDAQFRRWWAGTHVAVKRRGTRTYNHPVVGEITLDWDAHSRARGVGCRAHRIVSLTALLAACRPIQRRPPKGPNRLALS